MMEERKRRTIENRGRHKEKRMEKYKRESLEEMEKRQRK